MKQQSTQFGILTLALLPLFLVPAFLGLKNGSAKTADFLSGLLPIFPYVSAFCWIITRKFDRHSVFRKFPFRGSLWIGSLLGFAYGLLFSLGFCAGMFNKPLLDEIPVVIGLCVGGTALLSSVGALAGAVIGMAAGATYCWARSVRERLTGESTIRPGQASFRKSVESTSARAA